MLSDIAFSEKEGSILFQIGGAWIQCPWAGHPIIERTMAGDAIRLTQVMSEQAMSSERGFREWLRHQIACFESVKDKIMDVWCEGLDQKLGFNDPSENWLVFEGGKLLSVHYATPVFGPSLPTLVLEDAATFKDKTGIVSFFDMLQP